MLKIEVEINDKKYTLKAAISEEELSRGLMGVSSLSKNEGMIFIFDLEEEVSFWMKDTELPLDIIFVDEDGDVTKVAQGKPYDETFITGRALCIIELNINSGVSVGDHVFTEDEDYESTVNEMFILGSDGLPQASIIGGERIFSRKNTKTMVRMAKRAYKSKTDKDFKALGKKVFKYLDIQDSNDPEFVSLPESK